MKKGVATFQIGKSGFTGGLIETLRIAFKDREKVRVVLLKSAGHTKEKTREIAEKLIEGLGKNYTCRIIGFTISIHKWRKAMRK